MSQEVIVYYNPTLKCLPDDEEVSIAKARSNCDNLLELDILLNLKIICEQKDFS